MKPGIAHQLEALFLRCDSEEGLFEAPNFAHRASVLDQLDALDPELPGQEDLGPLVIRASKLRSRLEAANKELFAIVVEQIRSGLCPVEFRRLIDIYSPIRPSGQDYDYVDDLVAGVLQFEPPDEEPGPLSSESVFYQPTPARHIFHLIATAGITSSDTLIDLGSGLGHVPLLVSICAGATSVGVELDPAWVRSSSSCVDKLGLRNVRLIAEDARDADLSEGTVFYLYTPFTGATFAAVVESLRNQAALRPIRICTFGPCTALLARERWLKATAPPAVDRITAFLPS